MILNHPDGKILIEEADSGRQITVTPANPFVFVPIRSCKTAYPDELIEKILEVKGIAWLCDEISRDEDPNYVEKPLIGELRAYFDSELEGKRILDFGCGSGASTSILARNIGDAEIVGVELEKDLLSVAKARIDHYGFKNAEVLQSPNGLSLPENIGDFDLVVMSAVYEHLLPNERKPILAKLWAAIRPGGALFINQTPNRLFPFELHTTMLPVINYMPEKLAFFYAKKFSSRIDAGDSWESLLRQGIRGATVTEIMQNLPRDGNVPHLLRPRAEYARDRVDLWYRTTNSSRLATLKKCARVLLKGIDNLTGICVVPDLSLAIRKP